MRIGLFYICFIFFQITSCINNINNESISLSKSNKQIIENQDIIIKQVYSDFTKFFKSEDDFKLKSVNTITIDNSDKGFPKIVFFIFSVNDKLFATKFFVNKDVRICIGHLLNSTNSKDFDKIIFFFSRKSKDFDKTVLLADYIDLNNFGSIENSYVEWAKHMPYFLKYDTISSEYLIKTQKYNEKYLPEKCEIIGSFLAVGDGEKQLFFIVYKRKVSTISLPFVEAYDSKGIQKFSRKIFDLEFMKTDKRNFSRFYWKDHYLFFENYTNNLNREIITQKDSVDVIDLYEQFK